MNTEKTTKKTIMRKAMFFMAGFFISFSLLYAKPSDTWYKDFEPTKDTEYMKSKKGFAAQLQFVDDQSFFENWNKPGLFVKVPVTEKAKIGIPIFPIILFANPGIGKNGKCNVTCDFIVKTPSGKTYGEHKNGNIWVDMPAPEENSLQLGIDYMGISIEPKDPPGEYVVEATVSDNIKKVKFKLVQRFVTEENAESAKAAKDGQFLSKSEYENTKEKLLEWIRSQNYEIPAALTQRCSEDIYALIDYAKREFQRDKEMKHDLYELFSVADSAGMYGAGLVADYFSKALSVKQHIPQTKPRQGYEISFDYPNYSLSIPSADYSIAFPYNYMFYKLALMNAHGGYDSTYLSILSTGYGKGTDNAPSQATIMIAICKTKDLDGFLSAWSKTYTGNAIGTKGMKKEKGYWEKAVSLQDKQMSSIFRVREKNGFVQIVAYLGLNGTFKDNLEEFKSLNFFP